jgi:hypothetical protein
MASDNLFSCFDDVFYSSSYDEISGKNREYQRKEFDCHLLKSRLRLLPLKIIFSNGT